MAFLSIPKIVRVVALTEYAPELVYPADHVRAGQPQGVHVWVNLPREAMMRRHEALAQMERARAARQAAVAALEDEKTSEADRLTARESLLAANGEIMLAARTIAEWFAEVWSQGPAETQWTAEEVIALGGHETDPQLWPWLQEKTLALIAEHKLMAQKKTAKP